jgi:hypothetical protein
MAAFLRFHQKSEGGIAADIDFLDRVHLDRDGQRHVPALLIITPPHILEMPWKTSHRNHVEAGPRA